MKIQKIFRMQAVMIGIAAALFLASSAPAQEIENTRWDEGANVAPVQQAAPTAAADGLQAPALNSGNSTAIARPMAAQESVVSRPSPIEGWLIGLALIFMALLAPYRLARTRRGKQNSEGVADAANRTAVLS